MIHNYLVIDYTFPSSTKNRKRQQRLGYNSIASPYIYIYNYVFKYILSLYIYTHIKKRQSCVGITSFFLLQGGGSNLQTIYILWFLLGLWLSVGIHLYNPSIKPFPLGFFIVSFVFLILLFVPFLFCFIFLICN